MFRSLIIINTFEWTYKVHSGSSTSFTLFFCYNACGLASFARSWENRLQNSMKPYTKVADTTPKNKEHLSCLVSARETKSRQQGTGRGGFFLKAFDCTSLCQTDESDAKQWILLAGLGKLSREWLTCTECRSDWTAVSFFHHFKQPFEWIFC